MSPQGLSSVTKLEDASIVVDGRGSKLPNSSAILNVSFFVGLLPLLLLLLLPRLFPLLPLPRLLFLLLLLAEKSSVPFPPGLPRLLAESLPERLCKSLDNVRPK